MYFLASMKCPRCVTVFELIKNFLPHQKDDLYDDLLNRKPCSSKWSDPSFVDYIKRCYNRTDVQTGNAESNALGNTAIAQNRKVHVSPNVDPNHLLNVLVSTAEQNFGRKKQGFRYSDQLKMFAAYLKMLGGKLLYETLHANLPFCLVSPSKVNDYLQEKGPTISKGELRSASLKKYLSKRDLPCKVWISEDATRMTAKIVNDQSINPINWSVSIYH